MNIASPTVHPNRRYTLNETYFDRIDTEEKAYWLGLLAADGYVADNGHIELGLSGEEDRCMLEEFARAIGSNAPIKQHKLKYPNAKPAYRVGLCSAPLRDALIRLGVTPRKSLTLQFPTSDQVPPHLLRHFVRGYFDGDGSVSHKRDGGFSLGVTSSPDFIQRLALVLEEATGVIPHIERSKYERCHHVKVGGPFVTLLILDWLYRDSTVHLPRKQAKYTLCKRLVLDKLATPHHFYNLYSHPGTMDNAARCAKVLNVPFDMEAYDGLSIPKTVQQEVIELYREGLGVQRISKRLGHSKRVVHNTLSRNGVKMRPSNRPGS